MRDGPTDHGLAVGDAGEPDDDPLPCLPGVGDAVGLAVAVQGVVDAIGHPQWRLAERAEVAGAEVVGQGGVDLLGRVDVAVGHAPAQRLRCHVDQLDLVGGADHVRERSRAGCAPVIRSTTSLSDSRCWMLTVEMTSIPASSSSSTSCQRFSCLAPGMLVWASSSTSATAGRRARRRRRPSPRTAGAAVLGQLPAATTSRSATCAAVFGPGRGSRRSRRRRRCPRSAAAPPSLSMAKSCPPPARPRGTPAASPWPRPAPSPDRGEPIEREVEVQHVHGVLAEEAADARPSVCSSIDGAASA